MYAVLAALAVCVGLTVCGNSPLCECDIESEAASVQFAVHPYIFNNFNINPRERYRTLHSFPSLYYLLA